MALKGVLFALKAASPLLLLLTCAINAIPFDTLKSVTDTSAAHPTTLPSVPTVDSLTPVPVDHDLKVREDQTAEDIRDEWYMTCAGDHKLSVQFCEQRLYGYHCGQYVLSHSGEEHIMCGWACECKRGHPLPDCTYIHGRCYFDLDDDKNGQADQGPVDMPLVEGNDLRTLSSEAPHTRTKNQLRDSEARDAQASTQNPGLKALDLVEQHQELALSSEPNSLLPRIYHNYAIVCIERDWTRQCANNPYGYSCNANGQVIRKKLEIYCDAICGCVNTGAVASCFKQQRWVSTCFAAFGDGENLGNGTETLDPVLDSNQTHNDTSTTSELLSDTPSESFPSGDLPVMCEINGSLNTELTNFCVEHHYYCSLHMEDGHAKSSLHTNADPFDQCAVGCHCIGNDQRLEFERKANGGQVLSEADADPSIPNYIRTGVSVYYCIHTINAYDSDIDVRLVEFCQNEGFYCANDSPTGAVGFTPVTPAHSDNYPRCYDHCHCVHFQVHTWADRDSKVSNVAEDESAESSAEVNGSHTPANETAEIVRRTPGGFDYTLSCMSDYNITTYCQRFWDYDCDSNGRIQHSESDIDCETSCQCEHPRMLREDDSEASTESTNTAPPKGVPSQTVDQYTLNCGNTRQGPPFCTTPERGYFCNDKMKVMRTSTHTDPGITYCNNFCTCQFKYAKPCINEFGVPWCSEWWDGSVRDYARATLVLGKVGSVFMLPNGTMVLDKADDGFPYWASYT